MSTLKSLCGILPATVNLSKTQSYKVKNHISLAVVADKQRERWKKALLFFSLAKTVDGSPQGSVMALATFDMVINICL